MVHYLCLLKHLISGFFVRILNVIKILTLIKRLLYFILTLYVTVFVIWIILQNKIYHIFKYNII